MGNPIEIGAVVVWKVGDTFKAAYDVQSYSDYVRVKSEAAIRHLAVSFAYDNFEDQHAEITLREGGDAVNGILENELTERLAKAGIKWKKRGLAIWLMRRRLRCHVTTSASNSYCCCTR